MPALSTLRRIGLVLFAAFGLLLFVGLAGALWLRSELRASRPPLEGELVVDGLEAPVSIVRDGIGVPTIRASSRADLSRALGVLHAQERFFQMDLMRRRSSGELAALLGPAVLESDRYVRRHRLRPVAEEVVRRAEPALREQLEAYVEGVNAGLGALEQVPPEYLALRSTPEPFEPADVALIQLSMWLQLHDEEARFERTQHELKLALPAELADFLLAPAAAWEAALDASLLPEPPIPGPEVVDLRKLVPPEEEPKNPALETLEARSAGLSDSALRALAEELPATRGATGAWAFFSLDEERGLGSNAFAVGSRLSAADGALLSNDPHLGLGLPNVWYRAHMIVQPKGAEEAELELVGVTLPGAPVLVIGSNTRVAWGFTNSYVDVSDVVLVEDAPDLEQHYLTPEGPRPFEIVEETIEVRGGEPLAFSHPWTIWGPLVGPDSEGRRQAVRWVGHDPEAQNLDLFALEAARDVDEALEAVLASGLPHQNVLLADREGSIGWTIGGRVPRRVGLSGARPSTWSEGSRAWQGYLDADEVPRVVDPPEGLLYTANARLVGGPALALLGDGGYDIGARQRQLRDAILAAAPLDEERALELMLDDRALFLAPWRSLLLDLLAAPERRQGRLRAEAARLVEEWGGRASVDSAGYRVVRGFQRRVVSGAFAAITRPALEARDAEVSERRLNNLAGPVWRLVEERPPHLLDPDYESWEDFLLAKLDEVLEELTSRGRPLTLQTWGARNQVTIEHPLSQALPQLGRWLDIPPRALAGDADMPRVQGRRFGASLRLVVAPGREREGILHMPGGQSGHFLSPHYRAGHRAWEEASPTGLMPGAARHELRLVPAGSAP